MLAYSAAGQNQNVTVDDQPTAEQRLGQVKQLRSEGRLDAAAELMQELIEAASYKLVGIDDGRYTDAQQWCRDRLVRDGELRKAYRDRYSASAARALEKAQQSDDPVLALASVYQRYPATRPGLEAGLLRAGRMLERADASAAAALLDELADHPDAPQVRSRIDLLRGAAALYAGKPNQYKQALDRLTKAGQDKQVDALKTLANAVTREVALAQPGLVDMGEKPEELREALWDRPLVDERRSTAWMKDKAVVPVVAGGMVLVNNGRQVRALDRASGQRVWAYPTDRDDSIYQGTYSGLWFDAREVAVGQGVVSAVLGDAYGVTEVRNPYVRKNTLVCVDQQSGRLLWKRESGDIKDNEPTNALDRKAGRINLQHTHFVGTPIITKKQVIALLRRTTQQGTHSTWLLSYDLRSGSMLWIRHVSLSQLLSTGDRRNVGPRMALHGDTLYLTDNIATVAAVNVHTGGYRWLRVLPVGDKTRQRLRIQSEGVLGPPVPTSAGLLVCLALNTDRLVLLDPATGAVLRNFKEDPKLGDAYVAAPAGDAVLVVGRSWINLWDPVQAKVIWSYALKTFGVVTAMPAITRQYVVVPTRDSVLVLKRSDGTRLDKVKSMSGPITIADGEVFAVNDRSLHAYTTWDRANQRLVNRIKQAPEDPTAGLALAALALRSGSRADEVRKGIDFALKAITLQDPEQAAGSRAMVFDRVREMAGKAKDAGLRRDLYDRLALTTQTAQQEAAYHLDRGRFLIEQGEIRRAVDHFHAVVSERAFASQLYEADNTRRAAGGYAKQMLQQLIAKHGRSIYARYDALAKAWLDQHFDTATADLSTIALVARRFPLSPAAVDLLLSAANDRARDGRASDAIGLYQQAVILASDPSQRRQAVGQLLRFYLAQQRPSAAHELLERVTQDDEEFSPHDAQGKPMAPDSWTALIYQAQAAKPLRGELASTMGRPVIIDGVLIAPLRSVDPGKSRERFYLLHDDGSISRRSAKDPRNATWSAKSPDGAKRITLLRDSDDQLLLWAQDLGVCYALDPATGKLRWKTELRFDAEDPDAVGFLGKPIDATQGISVVVSDAVVCFAHRASSRVLAIDLAAGGVLWNTKLGMTQITSIDADRWTFAATGPAGVSNSTLALLNLFTGQPVGAGAQPAYSIAAQRVILDGGMAYLAGGQRLLAINARSERVAWSRLIDSGTGLPFAAIAKSGSTLAVLSPRGIVHLLDADQGGRTVGQQFILGEANGGFAMRAANGKLWLRSSAGLFCLDGQSVLKWRTTVQAQGLAPRRMLIGRSNAALLTPVKGQPADAQRVKLELFETDGGRQVNQYVLGPAAGPIDLGSAMLLGKGVLIPAGDRVLVVPAGQTE